MRIILACALALVLASAATAQTQQRQSTTFGEVELVTRIDRMTDDSLTAILVESVDGTTQRSGQPVFVLFQCSPERQVIYMFGKYFAGHDGIWASLRYRFDRHPAHELVLASLNNTHRAVHVPDELVEQVFDGAKAGMRLIMRVKDSDGETITDEFGLEGFTAAYRAGCR